MDERVAILLTLLCAGVALWAYFGYRLDKIESKLDKVIELLTADPQPGELLEDEDANP